MSENEYRDPLQKPDPMSALSKAESVSSYDPSWTDWVAQKLLGNSSPSTWKSNVVQNLTGSTGLGPTGYLSAKDFVPVAGQALMAQQAYHEGKSWPEVALNLVPGMSVEGRAAMLAENAAAKVASATAKAVPDVVDFARRSLVVPRAVRAAEPSVTTLATETTPKKISPERTPYPIGEGKWQSPYATNTWDYVGKHVEDVPIDWLSKMPGNDLRIPRTDIDELAESIKREGIHEPLIVNVGKETGTAHLGEGNHRLEALRRAGYTHAPVRVNVGRQYGNYDYSGDLIPKAGEYFSADAKPSSVFKSLQTVPVEPTPASSPSETSFLNKPVSRRAVNEGLAGAGAAAVLGPTFAKDLLHSSIPKAVETTVTPIIQRATPEAMASRFGSILSRPLTVDHPVLNKALTKKDVLDFPSPLNNYASLSDEGHLIEEGHIIGSDALYNDPETGNLSKLYTDKVRQDYLKHARQELESSLGHPVTDEEYNAIVKSETRKHNSLTDLRRDIFSLNEGGDEHPVHSQIENVINGIARNNPDQKTITKKGIQEIINNMNPEQLLTHSYGYTPEEAKKMLDTVVEGSTVRNHLHGILDDAAEGGILDESMFDLTNQKRVWKLGSDYGRILRDIGGDPEKAKLLYQELKNKMEKAYQGFRKYYIQAQQKSEELGPNARGDHPELKGIYKNQHSYSDKMNDLHYHIAHLKNDFEGIPEERLWSTHDAIYEYRALKMAEKATNTWDYQISKDAPSILPGEDINNGRRW